MYVDEAQRVILLVPGICFHAHLITKQCVFEDVVPTTTHTNQSGSSSRILSKSTPGMCVRGGGECMYHRAFTAAHTCVLYTLHVHAGAKYIYMLCPASCSRFVSFTSFGAYSRAERSEVSDSLHIFRSQLSDAFPSLPKPSGTQTVFFFVCFSGVRFGVSYYFL